MPGSASTIINSVKNHRVVEARKLKQRKHRQRQARFLVEDVSLLNTALDAGARPIEVFYCESRLPGIGVSILLDRFRQCGADMVAVAPHVMQTLSERDPPQGVVATFSLFETSLKDLRLGTHEIVVVLDRLQDPGNLGTLIRVADAVGAAAVILIEPCVDPFDPKTVRGTMGSLFNVPLVRAPDVSGLFDWLREKGLHLVGADAQRGQVWGEGLWMGSVALILGNETRGLSEDVYAQVDAWACLPIVGKAESLNVAVAGGVLLYAWLRVNLREKYSSQECSACTQQHVGQDN